MNVNILFYQSRERALHMCDRKKQCSLSVFSSDQHNMSCSMSCSHAIQSKPTTVYFSSKHYCTTTKNLEQITSQQFSCFQSVQFGITSCSVCFHTIYIYINKKLAAPHRASIIKHQRKSNLLFNFN